MTSGIVFDIKKFSVHDGPGIRSTVFLKGCGLRCWWCHNPESQSPRPELLLRPALCIACGACVAECPQRTITRVDGQFITSRAACTRCGSCTAACYADAREIVGREMSVTDVMAEVTRDIAFYDESSGGVTFSGGEPLLQGDFLLALLRACKALELHTAVDTCGHAPTETLLQVLPFTDLFLYDLKLMDAARHHRATGVTNTRILEHLRLLAANNKRVIVRIPIVPGVNEDQENIRQIGAFLTTLPQVEQVELLPYHRIGSDKYEWLSRENPLPRTDPPSGDQMAAIAALLEHSGMKVKIGG